MARKKISEFAGKRVLLNFLSLPYSGISIDTSEDFYDDLLSKMDDGKRYVLKVDQGIKQRKKKNLISFSATKENVKEELGKLQEKGYKHFILEEFLDHDGAPEFYFAIERTREGNVAHFSTEGGVEIEENKNSITTLLLKSDEDVKKIADVFGLDTEILNGIISAFDKYYFSFLEINPLVVKNGEVNFLDTAVEVDSTAEFFVSGAWNKSDFRESRKSEKTLEEIAIDKLNEKSSAAFSCEIINPNGSIFLILQGGGASIVVADEIYNQGMGEEIANYGEYSGNPNAEETYIYTKNVINSLFKSKAKKKVLIYAGGVANFSDIRIAFKGVIQALDESKNELLEQNVKVFVRRGGPHQKEGLIMMEKFLKQNNLLGEIHGPELILTDIVRPAIEYVNK